ncbi:PilZ domain-containing protein [Spartinivicinus poritis]|uniref:PilZ domain-containing protein n=1 Tax=Spartinivicinus poritis TaxID=2994640 RepID=A0ABT5U626_9GAMM|nr:PilZ domain-containing protein [Spartinivicinus sp. A2-2]MDE1461815.1 PilZ domain-containing protein [Spartinivicinus sp. A2-2]
MEERRRFFRIDDKVGLRFKVVTEQEWEQFKETGGAPIVDSQAVPCPGLEQQLTEAIDSLRQVSVEAADVAWLLNAKINGLVELIATDTTLPDLIKSMDVNISACGMAFRTMKSLQQDQLLYLEVTLKQQEQPLIALAKVVSCSDLEETESLEQFLVRVDFCDIEPDAQELLIQYVVKQQGQLLKQKKQRK